MDSNERYYHRRVRGLCGRNGCNVQSGPRSLCAAHLEEQRRRSGRYYDSQQYQGVALNLAGIERNGVVVFDWGRHA